MIAGWVCYGTESLRVLEESVCYQFYQLALNSLVDELIDELITECNWYIEGSDSGAITPSLKSYNYSTVMLGVGQILFLNN